MKQYISLFLKGMAMGIANVIPGVSGGTIALITEIYEKLINSLKSINLKSISLLFKFKFKEFIKTTNFDFLFYVFSGSIFSVFSIALLFEYLFEHYPILIWSFFFGLIISSIYFIARRITTWNIINVSLLIIGIFFAIILSFQEPSSENKNLLYIFICGIIGISGMMLPGLSGSYILILMGNYELLMVKSVTEFNILFLSVFFIGSLFGLIIFSHILSWILKNYRNQTLSILTGFIIGSLLIVWPWQECTIWLDIDQQKCIRSIRYFPDYLNFESISAILLIILGIIMVWWIEKFSIKK
tara:strand:+ start:7337 stop:8233 length:897 start_codon:yes stop_codon:yes gene_type:complete